MALERKMNKEDIFDTFAENYVILDQKQIMNDDQKVTEGSKNGERAVSNPQHDTILHGMDIWGWFDTPQGADCYSDKNKIYFTGDITESSMNSLMRETKRTYDHVRLRAIELDLEVNDFKIDLYITSRGGSVLEGFKYIDYVKTLRHINIHTYALGYIASMGFMLWLLSKNRYITKNSHILIHQLRGQITGRRDEMLDTLKHIEDIHKQMRTFIKEMTPLNEEQIGSLLAKESWLNAEEAVNLGLCEYQQLYSDEDQSTKKAKK